MSVLTNSPQNQVKQEKPTFRSSPLAPCKSILRQRAKNVIVGGASTNQHKDPKIIPPKIKNRTNRAHFKFCSCRCGEMQSTEIFFHVRIHPWHANMFVQNGRRASRSVRKVDQICVRFSKIASSARKRRRRAEFTFSLQLLIFICYEIKQPAKVGGRSTSGSR